MVLCPVGGIKEGMYTYNMSTSSDVKYRQGASFLLATLGRRVERAWATHLTEQGITTAQFTAMAALAEGERTQAQVATATAVDPRNVGATIRKLIEARWVQARPNPADARSRLLSLTPEGRQWWNDLQPGLRQGRNAFFHALTPDELTALEALLGKLDASHAADSINVPGQYT